MIPTWDLEPVGDGPLDPLAYPGPVLDRAVLLGDGRLAVVRPLAGRPAGEARVQTDEGGRSLDDVLLALGTAPLAARTAVVAVGANASPPVLARKLRLGGANGIVPVLPCRVLGIGVGHSAHVSRGGYVAAAPFADPGGLTSLHVGWYDDGQLAAVDRTEPNYRRLRLTADDHPLEVSGGSDGPATFDVYVSRHGVLGAARPLRLRPQAHLFATLADRESGRSVFDPADPKGTVARLARPEIQEALRRRWIREGFARPDGLTGVVVGGAG